MKTKEGFNFSTAFEMEEFLRLSRTIENEEISINALANHDLLTDNTLLKCAYFIAYGKKKTPSDVRIIEPTVVTLLINSKKVLQDERLDDFRKLFLLNVPLIILPLVFRNHWSLLYYRRKTNLWISMDSLSPYHNHYANSVPLVLGERGFLPPEMSTNTVVRFHSLVRQPPGGWQCGTYTLLFLQIVLTAEDESDIQQSITLMNEKTRDGLSRILVSYFRTLL